MFDGSTFVDFFKSVNSARKIGIIVIGFLGFMNLMFVIVSGFCICVLNVGN